MHARRCLFALAATLAAATSVARDFGARDPLFRDDSILDAVIEAPMTRLMSERPIDKEYDAKFRYSDADGGAVEFDIKIRTRGNFRRQKEICSFAPIRLNFRTGQVKGTLFHKQDKVKLVTHCRNNSRGYEQGVLREYLTYRIFNQLTDMSFGARLLRITYVDTQGVQRDRETYAFIIEHRSRVAKRAGLEVLEDDSTRVDRLDPPHLNLSSLFQFMIGNTDFSPIKAAPGERCCHNYVLFGGGEPPIFSVPYDFDMSGMVNLPHALPNPRFGLRSVRQRLYRGRCVNNDQLEASIAVFNAEQAAIIELVETLEPLNAKTETALKRYIRDFYKVIANPRSVKTQIRDRCL